MNFKAQRLLFKCILLWSSFIIGMEKLPLELIQKVGQHLFVMELNDLNNTDNKLILQNNCNLFHRKAACWIDSFAISSKKNHKVLNNFAYNKKLQKLWHQKRKIIPYFPYEILLLKDLIAQRSVSVVDHQREVVEIASNFFAHDQFFPVMFQQKLSVDELHKKEPLDDMGLRPRGFYDSIYLGGYHTREQLLCDWPFLFVVFYSKMLPYYQQADKQIKTKIESYIKRHTPFGNNSSFTPGWFWDIFIKESLSFLELAFSEKKISIAQLIDFINCYSALDTSPGTITSFGCFGNNDEWSKLSDSQKVLTFYYRNAVHVDLGKPQLDSTVYLQDCLYLIEKWLKQENKYVTVDSVFVKTSSSEQWRKLLKFLPFLFIEIEENSFDFSIFLEVLNIVLNARLKSIESLEQKRDNTLSKELFKKKIAQKLLQLTPSFQCLEQKSQIPAQIIMENDHQGKEPEQDGANNQDQDNMVSEKQQPPIENACDHKILTTETLTIADKYTPANSNNLKEQKTQSNNNSKILDQEGAQKLDPNVEKNSKLNPFLNNGKKPDPSNRTSLFQKIISFSVGSALTCVTLYLLFYTIYHQLLFKGDNYEY